MTFAECLQLFRESKPIAGLTSLILRENMLEIDLDEDLIGPQVRRYAADPNPRHSHS